MVYVLDTDGRPLMPTTRHGKVRRLLRDGLAVCVRRTPFTVRLLYGMSRFTQDVTLGVDAGSKTVGLSATTRAKELFRSEVTLRSDIVNSLSTRREARRSLHLAVPKKGGLRRSTVAPHWIGKTRLQRYDTVTYNGRECIIAGSTGGRPILRDILWKQIAQTPSVNPKAIRFLHRKKGSILWAY